MAELSFFLGVLGILGFWRKREIEIAVVTWKRFYESIESERNKVR